MFRSKRTETVSTNTCNSYSTLCLPMTIPPFAQCEKNGIALEKFEKGSGKSYQEARDVSSQVEKIESTDGQYRGFRVRLPKSDVAGFNLAPLQENGDIGMTLFHTQTFPGSGNEKSWIGGGTKLAVSRIADGDNYLYEVWFVDKSDPNKYAFNMAVDKRDSNGNIITDYLAVDLDKIPDPSNLSKPSITKDKTIGEKGKTASQPLDTELPPPRLRGKVEEDSPEKPKALDKAETTSCLVFQPCSTAMSQKLDVIAAGLQNGQTGTLTDQNHPEHKMFLTRTADGQILLSVRDKDLDSNVVEDRAYFRKDDSGTWSISWVRLDGGKEVQIGAEKTAVEMLPRRGVSSNPFLDAGKLLRRMTLLENNKMELNSGPAPNSTVSLLAPPDLSVELNRLSADPRLKDALLYRQTDGAHIMTVRKNGAKIIIDVQDGVSGSVLRDRVSFEKASDGWRVQWHERQGDNLIAMPPEKVILEMQKETGLWMNNAIRNRGSLFRRVELLLNYSLETVNE